MTEGSRGDAEHAEQSADQSAGFPLRPPRLCVRIHLFGKLKYSLLSKGSRRDAERAEQPKDKSADFSLRSLRLCVKTRCVRYPGPAAFRLALPVGFPHYARMTRLARRLFRFDR